MFWTCVMGMSSFKHAVWTHTHTHTEQENKGKVVRDAPNGTCFSRLHMYKYLHQAYLQNPAVTSINDERSTPCVCFILESWCSKRALTIFFYYLTVKQLWSASLFISDIFLCQSILSVLGCKDTKKWILNWCWTQLVKIRWLFQGRGETSSLKALVGFLLSSANQIPVNVTACIWCPRSVWALNIQGSYFNFFCR